MKEKTPVFLLLYQGLIRIEGSLNFEMKFVTSLMFWLLCPKSCMLKTSKQAFGIRLAAFRGIKEYKQFPGYTCLSLPYLGDWASATHIRSILQANTGIWGYVAWWYGFPGQPLVRRTSIINWRLVSHLTGSPNRTIAARQLKIMHEGDNCTLFPQSNNFALITHYKIAPNSKLMISYTSHSIFNPFTSSEVY